MPSPLLKEGPGPLGFTEHHTSGKEDWDFIAGEKTGTRVFQGPYRDHIDFITDHIIGRIEVVDGETFLTDPAEYPLFPGSRAVSCTVEGGLATNKDEEDFIEHALCTITVKYKLDKGKQQDPGGDDDPEEKLLYIEENIDSATEVLNIPGREVQIPITQNPDPLLSHLIGTRLHKQRDFTKIITIINYKVTNPFTFQPRWSQIQHCSGKINTIPIFTPTALFAPTGCLRYDGVSGNTKVYLFNDDLIWTITHSFAYYHPGWNTKLIIDSASGVDILKDVYLSPELYEFADFRQIFTNITPTKTAQAAALALTIFRQVIGNANAPLEASHLMYLASQRDTYALELRQQAEPNELSYALMAGR